MKKQILSVVLLLFVCTSQTMMQKKMMIEEEVESASLLEKYIPGTRALKTAAFGVVLFALFMPAKTWSFKPLTLDHCMNKRTELQKTKNTAQNLMNNYLVDIKKGHRKGPGVGPVLAMRRNAFQKASEDVLRLDERCFKQLDPKDKTVFFNQLDPQSQNDLTERLTYEELTSLDAALKEYSE